MDARYARLLFAMSYSKALDVLGLAGQPTPDEVQKAYRAKFINDKSIHTDNGGDNTKLVELNVAKDVLLEGPGGGDYDRSPDADAGGGGGVRVKWEPPPKEEVTFEAAKDKAGIPTGVTWMFMTDPAASGYSSDEMRRRSTGYVFYGQTDQKHVFVVVEHLEKEDYYIGGGPGQDIWRMHDFSYPRQEGETLQPAWLYGNVVKAFKMFKFVEGKKFNSKVRPLPEGWHFHEKFPYTKEVSIKHWLVNQGLVSGDDPSVITRKNVVEIKYKHKGIGDDEKEWFVLTINGRDYELSPSDSKKFLTPSRYRGVATLIFGDYFYDDSKKTLTMLKEPKKTKLFVWMSKNLMNLPGPAKEVIDSLATPKSV